VLGYYAAVQRVRADLAAGEVVPPDFVVLPDVVAAGPASLHFSLRWLSALRPLAVPLALVVQDGMTPDDVAPHLAHVALLFVGGSHAWKLRTGAAWVAWAHAHGHPCHIGRVGTTRKLLWARRIGADSVDSSLPNWSGENLGRFLRGFNAPPPELFPGLHAHGGPVPRALPGAVATAVRRLEPPSGPGTGRTGARRGTRAWASGGPPCSGQQELPGLLPRAGAPGALAMLLCLLRRQPGASPAAGRGLRPRVFLERISKTTASGVTPWEWCLVGLILKNALRAARELPRPSAGAHCMGG
jgi:hypothetical protein